MEVVEKNENRPVFADRTALERDFQRGPGKCQRAWRRGEMLFCKTSRNPACVPENI